MIFVATTIIVFFLALVGVPVLFLIARLFGFYTIVKECRAKVYILFGEVIGVLDEPGLHFPLTRFGARAVLVYLLRNFEFELLNPDVHIHMGATLDPHPGVRMRVVRRDPDHA